MDACGLLRFSILLAIPGLAEVPALPEGPGKQEVQKLCGNCHGVAIFFGPKRTREAWEKSVDQMAALGVEGSDEEFEAVVEYLYRHFGKINVNKAPAGELQRVLQISMAEAEAMVRHREANGEFKNFEGLKKVTGLDARKLEERRDRILYR